jgi:hypothetical protein
MALAGAAALPRVTRKTLQETDPHGLWRFVYRYPETDVPGALMGVRGDVGDFNRQMRQQAEAAREQFKKDVAAYTSAAAPVKEPSEFRVDYTMVTRTPGLLAFKFTQYVYFRGAAHPLTTVFTRNYDLGPDTLKLEGLFVPNSDYLQRIADAVQRQITAQAKKRDFEIIEPHGYAADRRNFQNFVITRAGLEFFLNPYQVAPGYVGILSAAVPWSALEPVLSDRGRLARRLATVGSR